MPSEDPQSFRSRSAASPRRTNGGDAPSRQPPASRHCMYDYPYAQCLTDPRIQSRRSLSDAYDRSAVVAGSLLLAGGTAIAILADDRVAAATTAAAHQAGQQKAGAVKFIKRIARVGAPQGRAHGLLAGLG